MKNKQIVTFLSFLLLTLSSCSGEAKTDDNSNSNSQENTSTGLVYAKLTKEEFDNAFSLETVSNLRISGTQYQRYIGYDGGIYEGTSTVDIRTTKDIFYVKNNYVGTEKLDRNSNYYTLYDLRCKYPHSYDAESGLISFDQSYTENYYCVARDENTHSVYYDDGSGSYSKTSTLLSLGEQKDRYGFIRLPFYGLGYDDVLFDETSDVYSLSKEAIVSMFKEQYYLEITDCYFDFKFGDDKKVNYFHYFLSNGETIYEDELFISEYGHTYLSLPETYSECNHQGCSTYDSYDGDYHYTFCSNCYSIISAEKHNFDGTSCVVCGYTPTYDESLNLADDICEGHIEVTYSYVTGECIEVALSDMNSESKDIKDENGNSVGTKSTYSCSNDEQCNLVVVSENYQEKIDGCRTQSTTTYKFYKKISDEEFTSLRNDVVAKTIITNHDYASSEEVKVDDCHGVITYTCSRCGDSYDKIVTHHTGYTVKAEFGQNIRVVCSTCGERIGLNGQVNSDNEYTHQYYYYGYTSGTYYSEGASGLIHTPSEEDPNICAFCGQEDIMLPLEESKDSSSASYFGYHIYYKPSDEGENCVSALNYFGMSPVEDETGEYTVLVCSGSDCCGLKIEYKNISGVYTTSCIYKAVTEFRIYKNDVLLKTLNRVRYYYYHEFDDANKIVAYDEKTCATITRTPCLYCDYVKEEISYNHDMDYWSEVDEASGLHTEYYGCIQCGADSTYETSYYGHWYDSSNYVDSVNHDIKVEKCSCTCGDTIYKDNPIGGFEHKNTQESTIIDNELATVKVTSCKDCSDFISLDVSSSIEATTNGDVATYTSGDNTLTIAYEKSEPTPYNGNECIKVTFETITITFNGDVIYKSTYLIDLSIAHNDSCKKNAIFDDGFAIVYQYDCGLYECNCD